MLSGCRRIKLIMGNYELTMTHIGNTTENFTASIQDTHNFQ